MPLAACPTSRIADEITAARHSNYVVFLHRVPFAHDIFRLGFHTGFREGSTYQQHQYTDLELPVRMLDNDFRNPDLDRYIERFLEYKP